MAQAIHARQLPLQQATPLRETSVAASVLCCIVRVIAAVALVLLRSIFCCCHQRSLEERAIQEIPTRNRDAVQIMAHHIFDEARCHFPPVFLDTFDKQKIIKAIGAIPVEERSAIMPLLKRTVLDGKTWSADDLVESLVAIRTPQKEEAIRCALLLIDRDMGNADRMRLVEKIAEIPSHERRQAAELTFLLSPDRGPFFEIERMRILEAVVAIPAGERSSVIRFARNLINPEMHADDIIQIMENVRRRPAHARAAYVAEQQLAGEDGQAGFQAPPRARINLDHPFAAPYRFNLGNPFPARNMDEAQAGVRLRGVLDVEDDDDDDDDDVDEVDDDDGVVFNAEQREVIRDGVNVHAGNRDQLVREAVEKLYAHQGPIHHGKLVAAVNAFVDYIFTSEKSEVDKYLAIEALEMESEVFLKKRQWVNLGRPIDFGPLFDKEDFIISGLQISGQELIGRLWIFTEQLKEKKDQINAKEGMIGALVDSYNDSKGRVCNGGKTQRLVIKVLQGDGRLKGVNVDRVEIPTQVPVPQAMRLFMTPENQKIDDFNVLKGKVDQFLQTNPGVDKAKFLAEITEYAENAQMTNLPKK